MQRAGHVATGGVFCVSRGAMAFLRDQNTAGSAHRWRLALRRLLVCLRGMELTMPRRGSLVVVCNFCKKSSANLVAAELFVLTGDGESRRLFGAGSALHYSGRGRVSSS